MGSDPDVLLVVGGASGGGVFDAGAFGSLARFGLALEVRLPGTPVSEGDAPTGDPNQQELPLSLTVAAFVLSAGSVAVPLRGYAVDQHTSSSKAQHLGAELADLFPRVAMVVMADGSACLDAKAPGYIVDGAQEWQKHVDAAFAVADFEAVAQLTEVDADRFWVAGRAAWQLLAGAALSRRNNEEQMAASLRWAPVIHYASAPYGVQYLAASFRRTDEG